MPRLLLIAGIASFILAPECVEAAATIAAVSQESEVRPVRQKAAPGTRPTIGLVLSGGGARGLAHVGVLEVLEELRVPVDLIAGTSMGAIVGGLYASGLPSDSLRALVAEIDWELLLSDTPPRSSLAFHRRAEERRYPVELEIGITRNGLALPSGLIAGQDMGLLLRRHSLPVATVEDFRRLPIPFAAVATDIETGERVVLDSGDLVEAMRASMAIPVVFSPVEREGRILVDGGLVDNMPVELAREMGADVVIAVDASPPLLERDRLRTVLGISEQVVTLLGRQDLERELASADAALDIGFEDVGIFDFRDADSIIAKGATVARDSAGALSEWSVSETAYRSHRSAVLQKRRDLPTRPGGLMIEAPDWVDERLVRDRIDPEILSAFDPELAERAARDVYAIGEFERAGYDLSAASSPPALTIEAHAKPRGPHVLRLGVDLATDSAGEPPARLAFTAHAAYVRTRIGRRAAEWRTDFHVGTIAGVETALRQPLDFAGRWFVEPSALATETQRPVFSAGRSVTEYETRRLVGSVDFGRSIGLSTELRAGIAWGRATSELDPATDSALEEGPTLFPEEADDVAEIRAAYVIDRLDSVNLPRRGTLASVEIRSSREELGADRSWTRWSLEGRVYGSRGPQTAFASMASGASASAEDLPVREEFLLGGFASLSGFGEGELRGEAFAVGRVGLLRRIAEIPPALRAVVAGGWIEAGDAWDRSDDEEIDLRPSVTLAVGAETLFGPLFLAWSRADEADGRITVSLGRYP
ncbi:MAG TPA: patatin-like phospholipase family protein [Gemmatimonadota bacterium]|nr:patatin-like phospholipase family protein [Gemmatimonadota bacterium]